MAFFTGEVFEALGRKRLVIREVVGEGAFGAVCRSEDQRGNEYALKIIEMVEVGVRAARSAK